MRTSAALIFLTLLALFALSLFTWGRDQWLSPRIIEQKQIRRGMTIGEIEYALGLQPGSTSRYSEPAHGGKVAVRLADSGVGSWFVPQYRITLLMDQAGRLEKCFSEVHWRCDDIYIETELK